MSFNPFRIRILLFLSFLGLKRQIRSYIPVVPSKTIPDFIAKSTNPFEDINGRKKKNTLWGDTYLYGLDKGVPRRVREHKKRKRRPGFRMLYHLMSWLSKTWFYVQIDG